MRSVASAPRVLTVIPGDGQGSSFIFARQQVESLKTLGVDVKVVFFDSRLSPMGIVRNCKRIRAAIRSLRPDVVHVHYGTVTAFATALVTNLPLIMTFHGSDLRPEVGVARRRTYCGVFLSQVAALRATRILCVSRELRNRLWWCKRTAAILPIGVNLDLFKVRDRCQARRLLGWDLSEPAVLFNAGKAPMQKGLALAEAAIDQARSRRGAIRFEIMRGDVPPEQVPLLMSAADCLLVTSRSEGSPGVVKEAMACNLPVVSVDVGDVAERLKGVHPSCIVARDPAEIAKAVESVLALGVRSNGREHVAHISEAEIAKEIRSIYNSIVYSRQEASTPTAAGKSVADQ